MPLNACISGIITNEIQQQTHIKISLFLSNQAVWWKLRLMYLYEMETEKKCYSRKMIRQCQVPSLPLAFHVREKKNGMLNCCFGVSNDRIHCFEMEKTRKNSFFRGFDCCFHDINLLFQTTNTIAINYLRLSVVPLSTVT